MFQQTEIHYFRIVLSIFVLLSAFSDLGYTAEIRVPQDYPSITNALVVADNGDEIQVAADTYSEPNEIFPLRIQKAIALIGIPDPNDPNNKPYLRGDGKHTVVLIESGGVTLQDFKITNGSGSEGINSMDGGGICIFVGPSETNPVEIENCIIENNTCPSDETYDGCGGGIYCGGTYCTCFEINISNCIIRGNFVNGCGAGVFCALLSNVNIENSFIQENSAADHGGGMFVDVYAIADINGTYLQNNSCPGDEERFGWGGKGGGFACESYGTFKINNCTFSENSAKYFGGGIFTNGGLTFEGEDVCNSISGIPSVSNSRFEENNANQSGGAVYLTSSGRLNFSDTTFYRNDAGYDGAAIFVADRIWLTNLEDITLSDCWLEGNEAADKAGGIYLGSYAYGTFKSTRFLGNSSLFGGGAMYFDVGSIGDLNDCIITYNNSARGYAGGILASEHSYLNLVHCSIVGNFAPRERSGLYLDPDTLVDIDDSILWHNAGGSIEANGANINIEFSLNEDSADPNNGVICCDPNYVGWGTDDKIIISPFIPGVIIDPNSPPDRTYLDLQNALDDFDFNLALDSPCLGTAGDGGNMGADTGVGGLAGNTTAMLNIMQGNYDIRGRNISFIKDINGIDPNDSIIQNAVFGCIEDANIMNIAITGEEIFGGITIRSDVNFVNCNIIDNIALADGGGIYVADGNCLMANCQILSNISQSGKNGGGLYLDYDTALSIKLSTVSENKAGTGAGIFVLGNMTAEACEVLGNRADSSPADAGAVFISSTADISITDCNISSNYAGDSCGAIACLGKAYISNCHFKSNNASFAGALQVQGFGSLVCENCQFIGNKATQNGGALRCWNNTAPLFVDCNFVENSAKYGGAAVCWNNNEAEFEDCFFQENKATNSTGGAFYLKKTVTHFNNCIFIKNYAKTNGGVAYILGTDSSLFENCHIEDSVSNNQGGSFYITETAKTVFSNVEILNSQTTYYGGAVAVSGESKPTFIDVNISDCNAVCGGGLYTSSSSQSIFERCEFTKNHADGPTISPDGGGVWLTNNSHSSFIQCKFRENFARDDGGGISVSGPASLELWNTLFVDNIANNTGGALHFTSTTSGVANAYIQNCTIIRNTANGANGGGISMETDCNIKVDSSVLSLNSPDGIPTNIEFPNLDINYCCLQETLPGIDNIVVDPLLDPNTFELLDGSPCIDAGNPDPNMNDAFLPSGKGEDRNDMGITGGPMNTNQ